MSNALPALLLLEADDVTRELYRRELSSHYLVQTCQHEEEVLQRLLTGDIHVIVLEPAWADGQGWHLMESIRNTRSGAPLPIVFCTALDERRRGMDLGAAAYLVKPVLPQTLLDTLQKVLQG